MKTLINPELSNSSSYNNSPHSLSTPFNFVMNSTKAFSLISQAFMNSFTHPHSEKERQDEEEMEKVEAILKKDYQERGNSDMNVILKFINHSKIFKEISKKLSMDFTKSLFKYGKIVNYEQRVGVIKAGQKIETIKILLKGQLGVVENMEQNDHQETNVWDLLERIINQIGSQIKLIRKREGLRSKNSLEIKDKVFSMTSPEILFQQQPILQKIKEQCIINYSGLRYENEYQTETIYTLTDCKMLEISLFHFYECLNNQYSKYMNHKVIIFRKIPMFQLLDNAKLKNLIERLKLLEVKAKQFIYKEKQPANTFYLLAEGEIEISKTINLFSENPNLLFKNRSVVTQERNRNEKILPYADFTSVYNYQPNTKKVILSRISAICIFGEEEVFAGKEREVSAKVLSSTAKIYAIHLNDIEDIISKVNANNDRKISLEDFIHLMEQSITSKRILYRQTKLAEVIEVQNKKSFQEYFLEQSQGHLQNKHKKKAYNISKLNKTLSFRNGSVEQNEQRKSEADYNLFNFNTLIETEEFETSKVQSNSFSKEEKKIVNLLHKQYAKEETENSKVLRIKYPPKIIASNITCESFLSINSTVHIANTPTSQIKYSLTKQKPFIEPVNIHNPLFSLNEISKMARKSRRLQTQAKKQKIQSLYSNIAAKNDQVKLFF